MDDAALVNVARQAAYKYVRTRPGLIQQSDDILGDALLAAHIASQRWDGRGTFGGFAYGRCVYAIIDGLRSRGVLTRRNYAQRPDWSPARNVDVLDIPDATALRSQYRVELRLTVQRLLTLLSRRQRDVLVRNVMNAEPCEALAADYGLSQARVWQIRREALACLRQQVNTDIE